MAEWTNGATSAFAERRHATRAAGSRTSSVLLALLCGLLLATGARAHLMPAQRGTLNFVDDGAFMVLSLPVAAFDGVDDDGDGRLSAREFGARRDEILDAVRGEVRLLDENGPRPLEGLMVSPAPPDGAPAGPFEHVVVLGRFALADDAGSYRFEADLFGAAEAQRTLRMSLARASDDHRQLLTLTPERATGDVFPSAVTVFLDYATLGAEHIVFGLDHLLFLLVVLAASRTPVGTLLALTTFTAGHAITLFGAALGGWSVPPGVVEPAIAATIVAFVAFDVVERRRVRSLSLAWRTALVFGCALVHGLGLSGAFGELGLDAGHQLSSLAGFNVGIEAGQMTIALAAWALVVGARRVVGGRSVAFARAAASAVAASVGAAWFVQRLAGGV